MPRRVIGDFEMWRLAAYAVARRAAARLVYRAKYPRARMKPAFAATTAMLLAIMACEKPSGAWDDSRANPASPEAVKLGAVVYASHCASCHGAKLEGQPDWRGRLANGRMPAPPHDESGHTWHHADSVLFAITKNGLVPPHAPAAYASDMPPFGGVLGDREIWAVLAYIKSHWTSRELLETRAEMARNSARR